MKIQRFQNYSGVTSFQNKLILGEKIISRSNREQKHELAIIKRMFKYNHLAGDIKVDLNKVYSFRIKDDNVTYTIKNKDNSRITIEDIIRELRLLLDKKESDSIKLRKITDGLG